MSREVLKFDDLSPYLLLQNGNFLYKVPFREGVAVLKIYYGSRNTLEMALKSFENVVFGGQTSYMPKTRLRIERECLDIWSKHGFRVFDRYDDVEVIAPNCPSDGYMLLEYVERPKLNDYLSDTSISESERLGTYGRFVAEWGRRHEIAIRESEPRLIHENGDGKHVMIMEDGGFLWFDFEMVYRSRSRTAEHVSHEIIQYLWNILKSTPPELKESLIESTVEHYPDRDRLHRSYDLFFRHPNPFHRFGRAFDRNWGARRKKKNSKYHVAQWLRDRLEATA